MMQVKSLILRHIPTSIVHYLCVNTIQCNVSRQIMSYISWMNFCMFIVAVRIKNKKMLSIICMMKEFMIFKPGECTYKYFPWNFYYMEGLGVWSKYSKESKRYGFTWEL